MDRRPELDSFLMESVRRLLSPLDLASASANRLALLCDCGVAVSAWPQDTDEDRGTLTDPGEIVTHIASGKMESFLKSDAYNPGRLALSLDTMVSFHGMMLGKPRGREDAASMLSSFSGQAQDVVTGYVLHIPHRGLVKGAAHSRVVFRNLEKDEIESYLDTGEWENAAGGYRLQMTGWQLVERIEGSWSNVVGVPLEALVAAIAKGD